jgi:hypothetical protein
MIKKRCIRCRQYLRVDGTCQNPKCVRYVPEPEPEGDGTNNEEQTEQEES